MARDIDLDFLRKEEGNYLSPYVPHVGAGDTYKVSETSGPTLFTGVDMTQQSAAGLIAAGVPPDIVQRLGPILDKGVTGQDALELVSTYDETFEDWEGDLVDRAVINRDSNDLAAAFNRESDVKFDDLPREQQTVLVSLNHNYGQPKLTSYNAWKQATSGQWDKLHSNLRNFGDPVLGDRRNREADLLQKSMINDFLQGQEI